MNARQMLSDAFETRTREDGSAFYCLKNDAPEWVRDAVREAHGGAWPNDWIYQHCAYAADALAELDDSDDPEDFGGDFASQNVEPYTHCLTRWLADVPGAIEACDDAAADGLTLGDGGIVDDLQAGQYMMLREIYATLAHACEEAQEEIKA